MSRNSRGAVLVVVLWVIVLLSAVVGSYVARLQTEVLVTRNIQNETECSIAARSLTEMAMSLLLQDANDYDGPEDEWSKTGAEAWKKRLSEEFPGLEVGLQVWDEGSRLNLNWSGQYALKRLFKDDMVATESVLDWRDPDQNERPSGAEQAYYSRRETPLKCRDGIMDLKYDLRRIRGASDHYSRVEGMVTTFGPLNPNVVTPDVFGILCRGVGIEDYVVDRLMEELPMFRGKGIFMQQYDDLRQLPSLHMGHLDKLRGFLTFEGAYNINTMGLDVLKVVMPETGVAQDDVQNIFRRSKSFKTMDDLISAMLAAGMDQGYAEMARQYVTVRTSIFGIRATARGAGRGREITAVVRRYKQEPQDSMWRLEVLFWQEQLEPPVKGKGGDEPSAQSK